VSSTKHFETKRRVYNEEHKHILTTSNKTGRLIYIAHSEQKHITVTVHKILKLGYICI